jgi:DNA-entry nuclease
MKIKSRLIILNTIIILLCICLSSCSLLFPSEIIDLDSIPDYSGKPYIYINGNKPLFTDEEIVTDSYEYYSELDYLGRCGETIACIGIDLKPTVDREDTESISGVKPSGWNNKKYSTSIVDGGWIYNRSHLIGWQLTGETDNERNLITGTRYFNVNGMLPFENMVADYLKEEPKNHVMYRVTPIYKGNELVARGVLIEGYSVEDMGDGISFCVYVYNVQPGVSIDYATGQNWESGETPPNTEQEEQTVTKYFVNSKTGKFHKESCRYADSANCVESELTLEELKERFSPCATCNP